MPATILRYLAAGSYLNDNRIRLESWWLLLGAITVSQWVWGQTASTGALIGVALDPSSAVVSNAKT
jgi:hypothetical protein